MPKIQFALYSTALQHLHNPLNVVICKTAQLAKSGGRQRDPTAKAASGERERSRGEKVQSANWGGGGARGLAEEGERRRACAKICTPVWLPPFSLFPCCWRAPSRFPQGGRRLRLGWSKREGALSMPLGLPCCSYYYSVQSLYLSHFSCLRGGVFRRSWCKKSQDLRHVEEEEEEEEESNEKSTSFCLGTLGLL